ncbi:MAG: peptide synthase [Desulfobacteraceae bacterium]|nr:MAG: peptide synthase [Desulfobacteraceae bacterium]
MTASTNISMGLKNSARAFPHKRAIVCPEGRNKNNQVLYSQLTFAQLDALSDKVAFGLERIGIVRGTRTILMVTPGTDFFILVFAMFKVGAIPVVVDPGMGIDRMLSCLEQGRPKAFIGIEKAHLLRKLKPNFFKSVNIWVTVGRRWFWGGHTLEQLKKTKTDDPYPCAQTLADETAAIVFTTGSTGPAKGVIYTHGNFDAQIRQIQSHWQIEPDEIDLPTFPLFALFDPALGMTAVIPDMDPTKPAQVDPTKIIEAIENHGVTNMFASPALLNRVGKYGQEHRVKLPSLRRVISAGAPVSPSNIEQFSSMLEGGTEVHTPYGATEAVPIISIASREILSETRQLSEQGFGMCVGRPICDTRVLIIGISDDPINQLTEKMILPDTQVGEIIVQAPLVTQSYFNNKKANLFGKIQDDAGGFWHRMGDLGWKDSKGRIWFCGRKGHRVVTAHETMFTIPCEAIFNNHENVYRSALVGIGEKGHQIPVIFIEPLEPVSDKKSFINEMMDLALSAPLTKSIKHVFIEKAFPVDIRHNSKIFRETLAEKAAQLVKL